jgi:hypothetical protein
MNDPLLGILGISGTILAAVIGFILGRRVERARQAARRAMLGQVREWLGGVEKSTGVLVDTLSSAAPGGGGPGTRDLDARRKAAQSMVAHTNEVIGILDSGSLMTRRTKARVTDLRRLVVELDSQVKYRLLPLHQEILDRASKGQLTQAFVSEVGQFKHGMDKKVQAAYSDISAIRTALK